MGDLDSLVAEAKAKISALISKPKMAEKLLSKPPFRFLHDTVTAITNATGFGEGLYSSEELDSAAITDKDAKIAYLEKIFLLVGICKVLRNTLHCSSDALSLLNYDTDTFSSRRVIFVGCSARCQSFEGCPGFGARVHQSVLDCSGRVCLGCIN